MNRLDLSRYEKLKLVAEESVESVFANLSEKAELTDLSPSNPASRILKVAALEIVRARSEINDLANGLLLTQARDKALDQLAETYYRSNFTSDWRRREKEADDAYRQRLHSLPNAMSVAGPKSAYETHAKAASSLIKDVYVESPGVCEVTVHLLPVVGVTDQDQIIPKIEKYLETKRPLTDKVNVKIAAAKHWSLKATLKIRPGPSPDILKNAALDNLKRFMADQYLLGNDIVESAVHSVLSVEGVLEVQLQSWADIRCLKHEAPLGLFDESEIKVELINDG